MPKVQEFNASIAIPHQEQSPVAGESFTEAQDTATIEVVSAPVRAAVDPVRLARRDALVAMRELRTRSTPRRSSATLIGQWLHAKKTTDITLYE